MDITDALSSAKIAYSLDSRAKHRAPDTERKGLSVEYHSAADSSATVEKVVALDPCPLLLVTTSGRVIVLGSGMAGVIAVEGVDSANETQADILQRIGQAAWETLKVPFKDFYEAPKSGRKKPKPEEVSEPISDESSEETSETPAETQVDISEPSE